MDQILELSVGVSKLIGIVLPLMTIAGTALAYVIKIYADAREKRRNEFFELMNFIDGDGAIAAKMAAIYQLRAFPQHKDFIVTFCEANMDNVSGPAAHLLKGELSRTAEYFRTQQ